MSRGSPRVPVRILVAGALTVAVLGVLGLSSLLGGDANPTVTSGSTPTSATASTTSMEAATSSSSSSSTPPPTVRLNPAWPSKATSRYSEAEPAAPATTVPR